MSTQLHKQARDGVVEGRTAVEEAGRLLLHLRDEAAVLGQEFVQATGMYGNIVAGGSWPIVILVSVFFLAAYVVDFANTSAITTRIAAGGGAPAWVAWAVPLIFVLGEYWLAARYRRLRREHAQGRATALEARAAFALATFPAAVIAGTAFVIGRSDVEASLRIPLIILGVGLALVLHLSVILGPDLREVMDWVGARHHLDRARNAARRAERDARGARRVMATRWNAYIATHAEASRVLAEQLPFGPFTPSTRRLLVELELIDGDGGGPPPPPPATNPIAPRTAPDSDSDAAAIPPADDRTDPQDPAPAPGGPVPRSPGPTPSWQQPAQPDRAPVRDIADPLGAHVRELEAQVRP